MCVLILERQGTIELCLGKNAGLETSVDRITAPFRRAMSADALEMAELVNIAGDGLPLYLWGKLARPGQTAWDAGRERAKLGMGGFAFNNTVIREVKGKVAACLIGYSLADSPKTPGEPVLAALMPLQELQAMLSATWYVNVLAVFPEYRRKGFGRELVHLAGLLGNDAHCESLSLIMSDANITARQFYEANGFAAFATRPIVQESWQHSGKNWVLMIKNL